jgi:FKBP-type peptidyl-prolyl cis-trans isomerase FkpA
MLPRRSALVLGFSLSLALVPGLLHAAPAANGKTFQKTDTKVGSGQLAVTGSTVTVNYTGWLFSPKGPQQHGARFDSSYDTNKPVTFKVGAGTVIKGWDEGVRGMKVGGKRTLIVPAAMGFGKEGLGPVPSTSNLIFDVELIDVK